MLVSFWELIGSERSDEPLPAIEIEANSEMQSPKPPGQIASGQLLEANARWNVTRLDISDSELRRIVDETSTINPELRKELLYSWERGFIEDKQPTMNENWSGSFLRKKTSKGEVERP